MAARAVALSVASPPMHTRQAARGSYVSAQRASSSRPRKARTSTTRPRRLRRPARRRAVIIARPSPDPGVTTICTVATAAPGAGRATRVSLTSGQRPRDDLTTGGPEQPTIVLGRRRHRHPPHHILSERVDDLALRPPGAEGILAARHRPDAFADEAAQHDDAAVGRAQVLEGVHRDAPLARLGAVVGGEALALGIGPVIGLAEAGSGHLLGGESPRRIDLGELEVGRLPVVVGHGPADDDGPTGRLDRGRLLDLARELMDVGWHEVAHAHPHQLADPAGGNVD